MNNCKQLFHYFHVIKSLDFLGSSFYNALVPILDNRVALINNPMLN